MNLNHVFFLILIYFLCYCNANLEELFECDYLAEKNSYKSNNDPRSLTPWVASIFQRNENGIWKYRCGATLLGPYEVVTSAKCIIPGNDYDYHGAQYHIKYSDLKVVAGLLTSDYYIRDAHTQESEVGMVRVHKTWQGNIKPTVIGSILLKTPFNHTAYVQPVHIFDKADPREIRILGIDPQIVQMIAGFNLNPFSNDTSKSAAQLQTFSLSIQNAVECLRAYHGTPYTRASFDVVCGINKFKGPIPCFMEGAGLIGAVKCKIANNVTRLAVFFLLGVYTSNTAVQKLDMEQKMEYSYKSVIPKNPSALRPTTECNESDWAYFTRYMEDNDRNVCETPSLQCLSGSCHPIELLCDGIAHCEDITDESAEICQNQRNCTSEEFHCNYGACINGHKLCNGNNECADNSDENDEALCRAKVIERNVTCPPIQEAEGVETKCSLPEHLGGFSIDCSAQAVQADSTAQQFCRRYYKGSGQKNFRCQQNGNWSSTNFLTCTPDCGLSETSSKVAFATGAENVQDRGEWPWFAAIYKFNRTSKTFEVHCGGSLISTRVVLTAAHCVTEDKLNIPLNITHLRVVMGKLFSAYNKNENEFSQEVEVDQTIVHKCYNPNTYGSDIALIILKSPVKITGSVRTVCFSRDENLAQKQFKAARQNITDLFGTTVGFGIDDTKKISRDLKILKMPVVLKSTCETKFPKANKEIRYTQICAGYTNGSAVCQGDSGGGFVFPKDDSYTRSRRYYVQGIVSFGPKSTNKAEDPCNKNTYKVFTKVVHYADWIESIVNTTKGMEKFKYIDENVCGDEDNVPPEMLNKSKTSPEDIF